MASFPPFRPLKRRNDVFFGQFMITADDLLKSFSPTHDLDQKSTTVGMVFALINDVAFFLTAWIPPSPIMICDPFHPIYSEDHRRVIGEPSDCNMMVPLPPDRFQQNELIKTPAEKSKILLAAMKIVGLSGVESPWHRGSR